MHLDDVGLADQAEAEGAQREAARDAEAAPCLPGGVIRSLVEVPPLDRPSVLRPESLDVNERTLPLAEEQVLERRERQKVGFVVHAYTHSSTVTPRGRSLPSTEIT